MASAGAPMGSARGAGAGPTLVMAHAAGCNVVDVDDNRYVDFAAGFGALLLGHNPALIQRTLLAQASRLAQALGDVYPSDRKIELLEQLVRLYPEPARAIICQSGSDAVSAALKTAALASGRAGVVAFSGSYHGLGYGPLAACGLRASYREPFSAQLNAHVHFLDYPASDAALDAVLTELRALLASGAIGAVLVEPILGRGGVLVPPSEFLLELTRLCRAAGSVLIADEIWTGLGRSGRMLYSLENGASPDLVCLGKGLGGGLPISAVVGRSELMQHWQREAEVVHTSTFAGAPLAAATASATLSYLSSERLAERARETGARFKAQLDERISARGWPAQVRGEGLMLGLDLGAVPGRGARLQQELLKQGLITSTGGGRREVLVLTPPLEISDALLQDFIARLESALPSVLANTP